MSIVIAHDHDALDIIDRFAVALKKFGVKIIDVTKDDTETVDIVLSDAPPETGDNLWGT